MGDHTTGRVSATAKGKENTSPHYVNPKTVIVRWLAGETDGKTWAIREFIYLNIKARQTNGQDYFDAPATIAARLGKGVTTEDVHAATKRSKLVVRTGADGDKRRPWVVCNDQQKRVEITSVRKPQPPQRKRAARSVPFGAPGIGVVSSTTSTLDRPDSNRNMSLDETSSPLDKTSSNGTPQTAGRNVQASDNYSTTPPFDYKEVITAPGGAGTTVLSRDSGTGNKKDVFPASPAVSPSTRPGSSRLERPVPPVPPAVRPQAELLGVVVGGSSGKSLSQEDAYTELVRRLKRLREIDKAQSLDAAVVDDVAKQLAMMFDCGFDLRRQALRYVLGRDRGDAIVGSIKVPEDVAGEDCAGLTSKRGHCPQAPASFEEIKSSRATDDGGHGDGQE